jgi:hypothetical protein
MRVSSADRDFAARDPRSESSMRSAAHRRLVIGSVRGARQGVRVRRLVSQRTRFFEFPGTSWVWALELGQRSAKPSSRVRFAPSPQARVGRTQRRGLVLETESRRTSGMWTTGIDERSAGGQHGDGEGDAVNALIELLCRAHVSADEVGPLITVVEGQWAYCAERATTGHDWIRIPPTRRDHIGEVSQMQEREAS